MMNTKIIGIFFGALVVVGGGLYLYNGKSAQQPAPAVDASDLAGGTQPAGKKIAFSELLKQGGSYQCTVTQYVNETESNGTVFIHKDHIRGEFTTAVQGMNIDTTMVVNDGYTYTWSSMMPNKGFKAKVVEVVGGDAAVGTSGMYSFNASQIGDYTCESWTVDESKFVVPTTITFTEIKS